MFWISTILITMAALLAAFYPALRAKNGLLDHAEVSDLGHDVAVYKDQIDELAAELKSGAIGEAEAKQARSEIARRMFAAEDRRDNLEGASAKARANRFGMVLLAATALVIIPAISVLVYTTLGSPEFPSQPLAARLEAQQNEQAAIAEKEGDLLQLVERAEEHLRANPNDGRGWDVLAPIYFRLQQYEKSKLAFSNALSVLGPSAKRLGGLGEVMVAINNGRMTADAEKLFSEALAIDPTDERSRYYLSLNTNPQQNEKPEFSEEQKTMINGMVEGLDARLSQDGGSVEEWQQLIRALLVLGQPDAAQKAAVDAIKAYKDDPASVAAITEFANAQGLTLEDVPAR